MDSYWGVYIGKEFKKNEYFRSYFGGSVGDDSGSNIGVRRNN